MSAPRLAGLFCQSESSVGRSLLKVSDLAAKVKSWGMPAFGVADFSTLVGSFGMADALESGIRPIYGCRVNVAGFPIALLAKDRMGFANILEISKRAADGSDVPESLLAAKSGGICGISGGFEGEIAQIALSDKRGKAEIAANRAGALAALFGKGSFHIGIDHDGSHDADAICAVARKASAAAGCGLVAVNDARFMPGDRGFYEKISRFHGTFGGFHDFSLRSPDEIFAAFGFSPAGGYDLAERIFAASLEIADACSFSPVDLPRAAPDGDAAALARRAREGLAALGLSGDPAYSERLEAELSALAKGNFSTYVLQMAEMNDLFRMNGIETGPGRGSAPGSLVCHALGISEPDPLRHGLSFERFFNEWRSRPPDIDIDVPANRRDEAAELVMAHFGADRAFPPCVPSRLRAKGAIRQAARILRENGADIDSALEDRIACAAGAKHAETISALRASGRLRDLGVSGRDILDMAERLDGTTQGFSSHASGVSVSAGSALAGGEGLLAEDLERMGFFKFDILGVDYLAAMVEARKALAEKGIEIPDLKDIPCDDPEVFRLFSKAADLSGVFQVSGARMSGLSERMAPRSLEDLAALIALYRPAPLEAGLADAFIERRTGLKPADYFGMPELFSDVLEPTRGLPIYQEQIMEMAVRMTGMDMKDADRLRAAMKGKGADAARWRAELVDKAAKNGIPRKKAGELADIVSRFSEYGFNRSHAVSYAIFAYRTAWFKRYHPLEYMAAFINVKIEGRKRKDAAPLVGELERKGLLRPPSLMESGKGYAAKDGAVIAPLPLPKDHPLFDALSDLRKRWAESGIPATADGLKAQSPLFDDAAISALSEHGIIRRPDPEGAQASAASRPAQAAPEAPRLPVYSGEVLDFGAIGDNSLQGILDMGERKAKFIIPASVARGISLEKGAAMSFAGIFNRRYGFLEVRGIAEAPAPEKPDEKPAEKLALDFGKMPDARRQTIRKMLAALKGGKGLIVESDDPSIAGTYADDPRIISRIRMLMPEKSGFGLDLPRNQR